MLTFFVVFNVVQFVILCATIHRFWKFSNATNACFNDVQNIFQTHNAMFTQIAKILNVRQKQNDEGEYLN